MNGYNTTGIRITQQDPEYQKIEAERKARSLKFNAKILFWVGLPLMLFYGAGLILWAIALIQIIQANKIKYTYLN